MMKKKLGTMVVLIFALALVAGGVFAQEGNRDRRRHDRPRFMRDVIEVVIEATGLTPQEIGEQLRDGDLTLAELLEANGANVDTVVTDVVALITEKINDAVANERMTQEQADEILANLEERIMDRISSAEYRLPGRENPRQANPRLRRLVREVAEASGLEPQDIISQVEEGASLAEILTANGVDVATFVNEHVAEHEEHLNEAVEDGRMSQAVADARLNLFRVELEDALNRTRPTD